VGSQPGIGGAFTAIEDRVLLFVWVLGWGWAWIGAKGSPAVAWVRSGKLSDVDAAAIVLALGMLGFSFAPSYTFIRSPPSAGDCTFPDQVEQIRCELENFQTAWSTPTGLNAWHQATTAFPVVVMLAVGLVVAVRAYVPVVPAIFVRLDALPLNLNGKVDRNALPAPTPANTVRDDGFLGPRTLVEKRVVGIVAPLLGLLQVSMEDNFFLLGGHSLLGTQLIARIRDTFGVELSLRSLFDAPTVAKLSAEIERLLVEKLEAMTEDEAQRLLTAPGRRPELKDEVSQA